MIGAGDIPFSRDDSFILDNQGMASGWGAAHKRLDDVDIYVRDGVVSGIKVDDVYRHRQIPKGSDFSEIFIPVNDVKVYCFDIYPGSDDINKYQEIMQDVYSGDAILESIDKHPSDKGFVVMLVINRARMVFRKESYNEDFPKMDITNG